MISFVKDAAPKEGATNDGVKVKVSSVEHPESCIHFWGSSDVETCGEPTFSESRNRRRSRGSPATLFRQCAVQGRTSGGDVFGARHEWSRQVRGPAGRHSASSPEKS